MKYSKKTERKLLEIAMQHMPPVADRGDLKTRNSDSEGCFALHFFLEGKKLTHLSLILRAKVLCNLFCAPEVRERCKSRLSDGRPHIL